MAKGKGKGTGPAKSRRGGAVGQRPPSAKLRRHYKEKARRQAEMRKRQPTPREKLVAGCMALGLASALIFLAAVTWTCLFAE